MSARSNAILKEALALGELERARLADQLLASVDKPDPSIDALWIEECDRRSEMIQTGKMELFDSEDVLRELEQEN